MCESDLYRCYLPFVYFACHISIWINLLFVIDSEKVTGHDRIAAWLRGVRSFASDYLRHSYPRICNCIIVSRLGYLFAEKSHVTSLIRIAMIRGWLANNCGLMIAPTIKTTFYGYKRAQLVFRVCKVPVPLFLAAFVTRMPAYLLFAFPLFNPQLALERWLILVSLNERSLCNFQRPSIKLFQLIFSMITNFSIRNFNNISSSRAV